MEIVLPMFGSMVGPIGMAMVGLMVALLSPKDI